MAKPNPRAGRGASRATAKSKKPASADVEVVDDTPGMGVDAGIAVMTGIVLLAALVMMDKVHGILGNAILFK